MQAPASPKIDVRAGTVRLALGRLVSTIQRDPLAGTRIRMVALAVELVGVGLLARSFTVPAYSSDAYVLFWSGIGICLVCTLAMALSPGANAVHHTLVVSLFGAILYLPTFLRSPGSPIFQDELYHVQSLELMRDMRTTHIPYTYFQIPGAYPGLEYLGLAIHYASRMSVEWIVRFVPLLVHVIVPVLAYYALTGFGVNGRYAALGALIYMANRSYYFFHATFSYESLGIVLFLFVIVLGIRAIGDKHSAASRRGVLLIAAVAAVIATHHLSGAMSAGVLLLLAVVGQLTRHPRRPLLGAVAAFAIAFWFVWLFLEASDSVHYLSTAFTDRVRAVLDTVFAERQQPREMLWKATMPPEERALTYVYPALVLALIILGCVQLVRRIRRGGRVSQVLTPGVTALAILGPLAWTATAPLIRTTSSDVVYRSWPFFYVGIALFATVGLSAYLRATKWRRALGLAVAGAVVGALLAGSIVLGDNQAGRFRPAEPQFAAGPEVFTEDIVAAAQWLQDSDGRFNVVIGDQASAVMFAVYGYQMTHTYGPWMAFYADDIDDAQRYLDTRNVEYVVVDLRDSRYRPRYQHFFSKAEVYDPSIPIGLRTQPIDPRRLAKFDSMPNLERIYDNGDIILYRNRGR